MVLPGAGVETWDGMLGRVENVTFGEQGWLAHVRLPGLPGPGMRLQISRGVPEVVLTTRSRIPELVVTGVYGGRRPR
eukprot:2184784-Rhodomonas_salina.1